MSGGSIEIRDMVAAWRSWDSIPITTRKFII